MKIYEVWLNGRYLKSFVDEASAVILKDNLELCLSKSGIHSCVVIVRESMI